jgi:Pvc16 N-terminal domain
VSSALAIAGVTAVLRDLLNDGFVNHNVGGVLGSSVIVSTLPPDKVVKNNDVEATQINLFMRHVTPNLGWRNEGLPSRDGSGRNRLSNQPLALNLHYLISAYGSADLHAEILLGYAMQLLHENPALTRDGIRTALQPSPDVGTTLPPALRALADSGLQDQVEQLSIKPEFLSTEEMSKFWTATLAHYRPSAAYEVSVVLIQAEEPAPLPLPVLTRRVAVNPNLLPLVPNITAVVPAGSQFVVQLGTTVTLTGSHLDGSNPEAILANDRFEVDESLPAAGGSGATKLLFSIPPASAADFPVGVYRVGARVQLTGEPAPRTSNQLAMTLAPALTTLPAGPVARDGAGTATFSIGFTPAVRAGQIVRLVLGTSEFAPQPFAEGATSLNFVIPNAPVGTHLTRLRIDDIDSPIIDPSQSPPVFLDKRIEIQ